MLLFYTITAAQRGMKNFAFRPARQQESLVLVYSFLPTQWRISRYDIVCPHCRLLLL